MTLDTKKVVLRCEVCLRDGLNPAFVFDGYQIDRCPQCTHLGVSVAIPGQILRTAYSREYYGGPDVVGRGYENYLGTMEKRLTGFQARIKQIQRFVAKPGRLLDFGCAVGLFLKAAKDAGWVATGVERSEWAATYGRQTFGVDIETGDVRPDFFPRGSFDVVTLWDVLEHLEHPRAVLAMVHSWLRPNGLVFLNTVNSSSLAARLAGREWRHIAPPYHLQYFTRKSLLFLLQDLGFTAKNVAVQGVLLDSGGPNRPVARHLRPLENLMTHWRLRPIATALNLLDEIEVVALKCDGRGPA